MATQVNGNGRTRLPRYRGLKGPDALRKVNAVGPVRSRSRPAKLRFLTPSMIDGRLRVRKDIDNLVANIVADKGGPGNISTIEHGQIEAYATTLIQVRDLNARKFLGEQVDLVALNALLNSMTRIASQLGLQRRPRDCSPSLGELITLDAARQAELAEREP